MRLPGIAKIGYVPSGNIVPNLMLHAIVGSPIHAPMGINWLDTGGMPASCEAKSEWKHNNRIETTTLSFVSSTPLPSRDDIAFVIVDGNLDWWLVGRRELPRNRIEETVRIDAPGGDPSAYRYQVTSVALRSLVRISPL